METRRIAPFFFSSWPLILANRADVHNLVKSRRRRPIMFLLLLTISTATTTNVADDRGGGDDDDHDDDEMMMMIRTGGEIQMSPKRPLNLDPYFFLPTLLLHYQTHISSLFVSLRILNYTKEQPSLARYSFLPHLLASRSLPLYYHVWIFASTNGLSPAATSNKIPHHFPPHTYLSLLIATLLLQ